MSALRPITWPLAAAVAIAVLLFVALTDGPQATAPPGTTRARPGIRGHAAEALELDDATGRAEEASSRTPATRAAAAAAEADGDAWHFRIRTALKRRRPEGHGFVIELQSTDGELPRTLLEGRTDGKGRADLVWEANQQIADLAWFTCRITDADCVPHRVNFEESPLDDRPRAKVYIDPEAYSSSGVQAVDRLGRPVECTFVLVREGAGREALSPSDTGYAVVPTRHLDGAGYVHASSPEHGTGRVELRALVPGRTVPHELVLGSDGGATGLVTTTGGSPLAHVSLRIRLHRRDDAAMAPAELTALTRRRFSRTSRRFRDMQTHPIATSGEGLTQTRVTTDEHGRFDALTLCPGQFDVLLVLENRGEVPIGSLVSAASHPMATLVAPYTRVELDRNRKGHILVLFDVTDGGSIEAGLRRASMERSHASLIDESTGDAYDLIDRVWVKRGEPADGDLPGSTAVKSPPKVNIGKHRSPLLRTGRLYEAVFVVKGSDPAEIVRTVPFEVPELAGRMTVSLR